MISDYDALTHVTWWRHTITDSANLVSNISTSTHIHFSLYLIHFESNKLTLFYAIHQTLSLNIPSKISHFFFERSYLLEEIQHQDCVLTSSLPRIYIFPFCKLTASGVNWSNGGKLRLNPVIPVIVIQHWTNHENKGRNIAPCRSYTNNWLLTPPWSLCWHSPLLQPACWLYPSSDNTAASLAQEGLRITDFCFHKQSFDRRQVEGDWSRYGEISTG